MINLRKGLSEWISACGFAMFPFEADRDNPHHGSSSWDPLQELIGIEKVWSLALSGRACNGCEPTRLSSRPEESHLRALPGRVEDWRAGWGRSISTLPRFQPPPRRTQHADLSGSGAIAGF
jgi:hypothetical protein